MLSQWCEWIRKDWASRNERPEIGWSFNGRLIFRGLARVLVIRSSPISRPRDHSESYNPIWLPKRRQHRLQRSKRRRRYVALLMCWFAVHEYMFSSANIGLHKAVAACHGLRPSVGIWRTFLHGYGHLAHWLHCFGCIRRAVPNHVDCIWSTG